MKIVRPFTTTVPSIYLISLLWSSIFTQNTSQTHLISKNYQLEAQIMSNNYRKTLVDRRNKVALALAKSVTKPQDIEKSIGEDVGVVYQIM